LQKNELKLLAFLATLLKNVSLVAYWRNLRYFPLM